MRLKYAFKLWLRTFLIGFIGLLTFSLLLHNPNSVEISAYGTMPQAWYYGLFAMIVRTTPYLFYLTLLIFPLGLLFYHPESTQENTPITHFTVSSLKKKTMVPAYITTVITCIGLYRFGSGSDMSGMGALVVVAMLMLFLFILAPINVYIWIRCMRQSREVVSESGKNQA